MEQEKKEPEETIPANTINIRVVAQDGSEILFRIKKTTPLKKLIESWCTRMGTSMQATRFLYEGQRINAEQTPEDLKMEDKAIVDAVLQQVGGYTI